ncbi:MAG: hypothetical protein IT378_09480 [Sandaracinaceae bacterium]|nr:hypothetical protein [Sandaracinaceae bacterium]
MILERLRLPGVSPLEVWDLPVRGRLWYRALRGADPAHALVLGLQALHARHAFDRAHVEVEPERRRALRDRIRNRGYQLAFTITFGRHGRWAGVHAGARLLREGVVCDLGQTSLKLGVKRRGRLAREIVDRDLAVLPVALTEHAASRRGRGALIAWIAGALLPHLAGSVSELVLALPARVSARGVPGPCTYGGLAGSRFVPGLLDALEARGGHVARARVVNDAELAAGLVRAGEGERVLALTLGFGPGAALVSGRA